MAVDYTISRRVSRADDGRPVYRAVGRERGTGVLYEVLECPDRRRVRRWARIHAAWHDGGRGRVIG